MSFAVGFLGVKGKLGTGGDVVALMNLAPSDVKEMTSVIVEFRKNSSVGEEKLMVGSMVETEVGESK